jgi:VanZ family protein
MLIFFSERVLSLHLRVAGMLLALAIILSLFIVGAHPIAVNLIPSPWDKLAHGCIFALLTCSVGMASGLQGWRRLFIAIGTALLAGALDEWHQVYLPGRQAAWSDMMADVAGTIVGAALLAKGINRG